MTFSCSKLEVLSNLVRFHHLLPACYVNVSLLLWSIVKRGLDLWF